MRSALRIGSIAGIAIEVHFSWLIIVVLLAYSLATGWFPLAAPAQPTWLYWVAAAGTTLLFFASVVAHELAHALVARARGLPVSRITLFIFGGVSNLEREPQRAGVEFQMAFVGPLTSLILGGLAVLVVSLWHGMLPLLAAAVTYLGVGNLALGVFNLIPGFPLDGGRILRSIIWKATGSLRRATRWAVGVGQVVAIALILGGLWLFFASDPLNGLWIGFIGLFLWQAAQAESAQVALESSLAGVPVHALMTTALQSVPPTLSAQELVDENLLQLGQRAVPVVDHGQLVGMVSLRDVRQLPRDQWPSTPVAHIMTPRERLLTVQPTQPVLDALTLMAKAGITQLPVVRSEALMGLIDMEAIVRQVDIRHELGLDRQPQNTPAQPRQAA